VWLAVQVAGNFVEGSTGCCQSGEPSPQVSTTETELASRRRPLLAGASGSLLVSEAGKSAVTEKLTLLWPMRGPVLFMVAMRRDRSTLPLPPLPPLLVICRDADPVATAFAPAAASAASNSLRVSAQAVAGALADTDKVAVKLPPTAKVAGDTWTAPQVAVASARSCRPLPKELAAVKASLMLDPGAALLGLAGSGVMTSCGVERGRQGTG
jgi:hypothetical protein